MNFNFDVDDCIIGRQSIMQFYRNISTSGRKLHNYVKESAPVEDVMCDFQLMFYINIMYVGHQSLIDAGKIVDKSGKPVIHLGSRQRLNMIESKWNQIKSSIPIRNNQFYWMYSDVDDCIGDKLESLRMKTFYPISNIFLQNNHGIDSSHAYTLSHLITSYIFTSIAIEKGMIGTHHIKSSLLSYYCDGISKLIEYLAAQLKCEIFMNNTDLERTVDLAVNTVICICQEPMNAAAERAEELDLTRYVMQSDYTVEKVMELKKRSKVIHIRK